MTGRESDQEIITQRLRAMGIEVRLMEGRRCALARMRLQNPQFETAGGSLRVDYVIFATVGANRIKCLRPRALFQLPLLNIVTCRDAIAIEARLRLAWQAHRQGLERSRSWLSSLGTRVVPDAEGSILTFAISGENPQARAVVIDPERIILPSRGPLSGITLQRAEDRSLAIDRSCASSLDLEISISNRLEELKRLDARLADRRRRSALAAIPVGSTEYVHDRKHRLLVVGPRLARDRNCIESLRVRGYRVEAAQSEAEALRAFENTSPELVLADVSLGRSEGIELILSLRRVPGLEEVPVILVDEQHRPARRRAAQQLGAAGYLIRPVEVGRIAGRLAALVDEPRRRRFTRYAQRLSVRIEPSQAPCLATTLGRGGMFLSTEQDLPTRSLQRCEVSLPQLGHSLKVHGEVLYRSHRPGSARGGVGVRFHTFQESHEPLLIDYLRSLEHSQRALA